MADRGESTKEVKVPGFFWSLIALSYRKPVLQRTLSVIRVMTDRVLRRTLGYALLPVSPRYLHLFRIQSDMAGAIEASVLKPRRTSKQVKTDTRAPVA